MFVKGLLLLLAANCLSAGRLLPQPEARIVGGKEVPIESAPWQVHLRLNGKPHCGGSIYSETIIITAAHCLYDKNNKLRKAEDLTVLAGSANKLYSENVVKVTAIKPHNDYDFTKYYNDIGIVKLRRPLDLTTQKMKKIHLAENDPAPGTEALVTGWGNAVQFLDDDKKLSAYYYPDYLQAIKIQIQNQILCNGMFDIIPKTICAGTTNHTTCDGDSGGPLVVGGKLAGVVSSGGKHCTSLTVYTSVFQFRGWIEREANSI